MNKYLLISVVLAIGLIGYAGYASRCQGKSCDEVSKTIDYQIYINMNPENIKQKIENQEIVLIDVREKSEWDEGHIAGAILIPLGDLSAETTKNLPKDKPIFIYCRSGNRAGSAEKILQSLGFTKAENIGGIIHWVERGGELVS